MDWLWIPAVAVLTVFIFVLCWLFFSSYTCCPCRRKSTGDSILPTHVGSEASPFTGPRAYPPSAPQHYPGTPSESPTLHLKYADVPKSSGSGRGPLLPTLVPSISSSFREPSAPAPKLSSHSTFIHSTKKVLDVSAFTNTSIKPSSSGYKRLHYVDTDSSEYGVHPTVRNKSSKRSSKPTTTRHVPPSVSKKAPKVRSSPKASKWSVPIDIKDSFVKPSIDHLFPSPSHSNRSSIKRKPTKRLKTRRVPYPYDRTASGSFHLHFRHGDFSLEKVYRIEDGIQALDLHGMTVDESETLVNELLDECETEGRHDQVRIITGRGINSDGGKPKIKPAVRNILDARNLEFSEISGGGCFEVNFGFNEE